MTWWLVPSKAKRDSQELFFLVIELNLILYSPDIVVAKKGCRLYTAVYTSIGRRNVQFITQQSLVRFLGKYQLRTLFIVIRKKSADSRLHMLTYKVGITQLLKYHAEKVKYVGSFLSHYYTWCPPLLFEVGLLCVCTFLWSLRVLCLLFVGSLPTQNKQLDLFCSALLNIS